MRFTPSLEDGDVKVEAVRMVTKQMETRAEEEYKLALEREKESAEAAAVSTQMSLFTVFVSNEK